MHLIPPPPGRQVVVPSVLGCTPTAAGDSAMETTGDDGAPTFTYTVGSNRLAYPRPGMEIRSPLKDGLIEDWGLYEELVQYTCGFHQLHPPSARSHCLCSHFRDPAALDHPLGPRPRVSTTHATADSPRAMRPSLLTSDTTSCTWSRTTTR